MHRRSPHEAKPPVTLASSRVWPSVALCLASSAAGCGGGGGASQGLTGMPPTVAISALRVAGEAAVDRNDVGCLALPADGFPVLLVETETDRWTFRPPDACGSAVRCGALRVTLLFEDDAAPPMVEYAALENVQVDLTDLDTSQTLRASIEAQLVDDRLLPFVDPTTTELPETCGDSDTCDAIEVELARDCD